MKITLKQLVNSGDGLRRIGALELRPGVAFRCSRAIRFQTSHAEDYEQARKALIRKFAKKDEKGNPVTTMTGENKFVVWEDAEGFEAAITALLAEEIEVQPSLKRIKLSEFDCPLKSEWLNWLEWLIEDDSDSEPKKPKQE